MTSPKRHIVITGTGRSGTTLLVELMTHLGLNTGFQPGLLESLKIELINAGLEHTVGTESCPYIAKDPWFCDYAEDIFSREDVLIEHIIIPMRDIESAAASRRLNDKRQFYQLSFKKRILYRLWPYPLDGGLWDTISRKKGTQESILIGKVYKLLLEASKHQVPVTFINFPKMTLESDYLYKKLSPVLKGISFPDFQKVFQKTVKPDLVHSYNKT